MMRKAQLEEPATAHDVEQRSFSSLDVNFMRPLSDSYENQERRKDSGYITFWLLNVLLIEWNDRPMFP